MKNKEIFKIIGYAFVIICILSLFQSTILNVIAGIVAIWMLTKWMPTYYEFKISTTEFQGRVISFISIALIVIAIFFGITTMNDPKINSSECFGIQFAYFLIAIILTAPLILGLFLSKFKSVALYVGAALVSVIIELATIYMLNFLRNMTLT